MEREPKRDGCTVEPFPHIRQQQVDWLELMHRQHTIHALLEVDVTLARRSLKLHAAESKQAISLTAFIVWCVARAVDADKRMQAYRRGRSRLVLFDDVDVTVLVERAVEGRRVPVPFIVRAANGKQPADISSEIRAAQIAETPQATAVRWLPLWLSLPTCIRRLFWTIFLCNPYRRKRVMGTVAVSSIGMFGSGPAWGIPLTAFTLCVTSGAITRKPGLATPQHAVGDAAHPPAAPVEMREYLSLTLSMDHDVIDGAPAARYAQRLREMIEAGLSHTPANVPKPSEAIL